MALLSRAVVVCAVGLLGCAGSAIAGPPGKWTPVLPASQMFDSASVARTPDGVLHVLWSGGRTVFNTRIARNAAEVTGPHAVFEYGGEDGGASDEVALAPTPAGGLRAFFAGLYLDDPHDIGMSTATSMDGIAWTVQPTLASASAPDRRASVFRAVGIGGTVTPSNVPVSVWGREFDRGPGYHVGTDDGDDDIPYGMSDEIAGPAAATDGASGEAFIAWNEGGPSGTPVVQQILPTPAPPVTPPRPIASGWDLSLTGRDGPGIFLAYLRGPESLAGTAIARAAVWRVGSADPAFVSKQRGVNFPGAARGLGGRIWAFWGNTVDEDRPCCVTPRTVWRIFATRSNERATKFGSVVSIRAPRGVANFHHRNDLDNLDGEGTAPGGMLDLVAGFRKPGRGTQFHQRIRPGITLVAKTLGGDEVRFRTFDAGERLRTRITFAGETARTGRDGEVVLSAEPSPRPHTATARAPGYHPATRKVRVE